MDFPGCQIDRRGAPYNNNPVVRSAERDVTRGGDSPQKLRPAGAT